MTGHHYEWVQRLCLSFVRDACTSFFPDAVLLEPRVTPVSVCVDEHEWPNERGALPPVMMSFTQAGEQCAGVGKRLCSEFEWELACEGPKVLPFGYGYSHEPSRCANDKPYKPYGQKQLESSDKRVRDKETRRLYQASPSGSHEGCLSPFGVVDMIGNVEEWVTTSRPEWPHVSSLKGGYWSKPYSKCRGTNDSHGPAFRFYQIGFRCCSDPKPLTSSRAAG